MAGSTLHHFTRKTLSSKKIALYSKRHFTNTDGSKEVSKFMPGREPSNSMVTGSSLDPKGKKVSKYLTPTQPGKGEGIHPEHDPYIVTKPNVPSTKPFDNINYDVERRRHLLEKYERETLYFKRLLAEERIEQQHFDSCREDPKLLSPALSENVRKIVAEGEWPWYSLFEQQKIEKCTTKEPKPKNEPSPASPQGSKIDFLEKGEKSQDTLPAPEKSAIFTPRARDKSHYFNDLSQYTFPFATWFAHFHPSHLVQVDNVYSEAILWLIKEHVCSSVGVEKEELLVDRKDGRANFALFADTMDHLLDALRKAKDSVAKSIYEQKDTILTQSTGKSATGAPAEKFHGMINYASFRRAYRDALAREEGMNPTVHAKYVYDKLRRCHLLSGAESTEDFASGNITDTQLSAGWISSVQSYIQRESLKSITHEALLALWCKYETFFLVNELLHAAHPIFVKVALFPAIASRSAGCEHHLIAEADRSTEARSLFSKFIGEIQRYSEYFLTNRNILAQWTSVVGDIQDGELVQNTPYSSMLRYPYSIFTDHKHLKGVSVEMYAYQHTAYYMFMLLKANACLKLVHLSPLRLYLHHEEEQSIKNEELQRRPWRFSEFSQAEGIERNLAGEQKPYSQEDLSYGEVFARFPQFFHAFLRSSCSAYDLIRFAQRVCFDHCVTKNFSNYAIFADAKDKEGAIEQELAKIHHLYSAFKTFPFVEAARIEGMGRESPLLHPVDKIASSLEYIQRYLSAVLAYEKSTAVHSPVNKTVEALRVFHPPLVALSGQGETQRIVRYIENDLQQALDVFAALMQRILDPTKNSKGGTAELDSSAIAQSLLNHLRSHKATKEYFTSAYIEANRPKLESKDETSFIWENQHGDVAQRAAEALQQAQLYFTLPHSKSSAPAGLTSVQRNTDHGLEASAKSRILSSIAVAFNCEEVLHAICKLWSAIDPTIVAAGQGPLSTKARDVIDAYNVLPSRQKQATETFTSEGRRAILESLAFYSKAVLQSKELVRLSQMRLRYFIRTLFVTNPAMEFVPDACGVSLVTGGLYGDHADDIAPPQRVTVSASLDQFDHENIKDTSPDAIAPWKCAENERTAQLTLPIEHVTIAAFCVHLAQHLPSESFSQSFARSFIDPSTRFLRNFLVMEPVLREKVHQEHPNWADPAAPCSPLLANGEKFGERLKFMLYEMQDVLKDLKRIEGDLRQQADASSEGAEPTAAKASENHNATLLKVISNSDYKHLFPGIGAADSKDADAPYALQRMLEISRVYPQADTISSTLLELLQKQVGFPTKYTPLAQCGPKEKPGAETPAFRVLRDYLTHVSLFECSKQLLSSATFIFLRATFIPNHLQALLARTYNSRVGSLQEIFPTGADNHHRTLCDVKKTETKDITSGSMYSRNAYASGESTVAEVPQADPKKKHVITAEVASHLSYLEYNVFKKFDIAGSVQRYTDLQNRNVSMRVRLEDLQAPSHVSIDSEKPSGALCAYPYKPLLSVHGIRRLRIVAGEKVGGSILKFDLDRYEKYQDNYEYGVNVLSTLIADAKKSDLGEVENVSGEYVPTVEVKVRSKNKGLAGTGREKMLDSVIDWDRVESESEASYSAYVQRKTEKGAGAYVGPQATWWKVKMGK